MTMRLDRSIHKLLKARRRLGSNQARIARRNARRTFLGAVRSVRMALDNEFPAIQNQALISDPIDRAASRMRWREFEVLVIRHVNRRWDRQLAEGFVSYTAAKLGVIPKPVVFDLHARRLAGEHVHDRIRLNADQSDRERWRTLIHELAHYRQHGHRRAFVRELAVVYKFWREFLAIERSRRSDRAVTESDPAVRYEGAIPFAVVDSSSTDGSDDRTVTG